MKNHFDKFLFETFGDAVEETTSLEMIDAWISARCDPEVLQKVFEENIRLNPSSDSSTVLIYKSLLEEFYDELPEGNDSKWIQTIVLFRKKKGFEFTRNFIIGYVPNSDY